MELEFADADWKEEDYKCFNSSYGQQEKIFNIPLKPKSAYIQHDDADEHFHFLSPQGLKNFVPVQLLPHNPASNDGLAKILVHLGKIYMAKSDYYSVYKMDVNIYWRCMKVRLLCLFFFCSMSNSFPLLTNSPIQLMYSSKLQGFNEEMRAQMCPTLGLWHPYKAAMEAVWKRFLPSFFAPAFHALFPDAQCFLKPKLVSITVFFTYMRLLYPGIQSTLYEAIEDSSLSAEKRENLLALRDVFEFFIPMVRSFPLRFDYSLLLLLFS